MYYSINLQEQCKVKVTDLIFFCHTKKVWVENVSSLFSLNRIVLKGSFKSEDSEVYFHSAVIYLNNDIKEE